MFVWNQGAIEFFLGRAINKDPEADNPTPWNAAVRIGLLAQNPNLIPQLEYTDLIQPTFAGYAEKNVAAQTPAVFTLGVDRWGIVTDEILVWTGTDLETPAPITGWYWRSPDYGMLYVETFPGTNVLTVTNPNLTLAPILKFLWSIMA